MQGGRLERHLGDVVVLPGETERLAGPQARQDGQRLIEFGRAYARVRLLAEEAVIPLRRVTEPTPSTNRPPDSRSSETVSRATFHGRRRANGVTIVPIVSRRVRSATAASPTQGSAMGWKLGS